MTSVRTLVLKIAEQPPFGSSMTTDKTWFDEKLKRNLYLDILLRMSIWLVVALLTIAYARQEAGFHPILPFQRGMNNLMPVVVDVMRVSLVLCFMALLLKDLEHVCPKFWGQETALGKVGGVVRRLAGDLSLWMLGALATVLASIIYLAGFVHAQNAWTYEIKSFVGVMTFILSVLILVLSIVSVLVRKNTSLVSSHEKFSTMFNTPWRVIGFYVGLILVTVASDWIER